MIIFENVSLICREQKSLKMTCIEVTLCEIIFNLLMKNSDDHFFLIC